VLRNRRYANFRGVFAVPVVIICSSNGQQLARLNGFSGKTLMLKILKKALAKKVVERKVSDSKRLMRLLKDKKITSKLWPDVMLALGKYGKTRSDILALIRNLKPFPKKEFAALLRDKRLAVRLGVLEVLEMVTGDDYDYDPWEDLDSTRNLKALREWNVWAGRKASSNAPFFSTLTKKRCFEFLGQSICGDAIREIRARRILRGNKETTLEAIPEFIEAHPEIPRSSKEKLKELEYSILIPDTIGKDPATLARRLVFGQLDSRMMAVGELKKGGLFVLPILRDLLEDDESMIRECAVDTLVVVAGRKAVKFFSERLEREKDEDVVFSILRALGEIKSGDSKRILVKYIYESNEDLAVAALNGLAAIKAVLEQGELRKTLTDKRWRVRVAALNLVAKTKNKRVVGLVEKMLFDKDEFVRYKAVETLSRIAERGSLKTLEKAFLKDDSLKEAVIVAYAALDELIPQSLIENLREKDDSVLMSVVQALDKCGKEALPLALFLAGSENPDIKTPAIRFLATNGVSKDRTVYNAAIIDILRSKNKREVLAVLRGFKIPESSDNGSSSEDAALKNILLAIEEDAAAKSDSKSAVSEKVLDLFEAFDDDVSDTPAKIKKTPKKATSGKDIIELFNAFEDENSNDRSKKRDLAVTTGKEKAGKITKESETSKPTRVNMECASYKDIEEALENLFKNSDSEKHEIKLYAACSLLAMGSTKPLAFLRENFDKQPLETRRNIIGLMERSSTKEFAELAEIGLKDEDDSVRSRAAGIILKSKRGTPIANLLSVLRDGKTLLKPYDLNYYDISSATTSSSAAGKMLKWAETVLKSNNEKHLNLSLAIFILDKSKRRNVEKLVGKLTDSDDEYLRRAAYHAIFQNTMDQNVFKKYSDKISTDASSTVRIALPATINFRASGGNFAFGRWIHFFDETHFFNEYLYGMERNVSGDFFDASEKTMRKMLDDDDRKVRMEASFALLTCRKIVDLRMFVALLHSFPDQKAIRERVKTFLKKNYTYLGEGFRVLLPFLDETDASDKVSAIFKHFNVTEKQGKEKKDAFREKNERILPKAVFLTSSPKKIPVRSANRCLNMVYFSKRGCSDCTKVKALLRRLASVFPNLRVETKDISKISSITLNEAYCEKFGVPEKFRLVAPAIFAGGGFLIKNDINMKTLVQLAAESAESPLSNWRVIRVEERANSDKRIRERYETTSIWMIVIAGLLDGVNPCAFATIIFFISYLRIRRKNPKEIFMVGCVFVSAVFLSYLAFGFGLNEIVARFYFFESFRKYFNLFIAFVAFIIMALSVYDGILCLRGRMGDMSLQLPDFLKERIRFAIRRGSKRKNYIMAAFITGCVVSFLELACTGQVYVPMIGYMWRSGNAYSSALFYLVVYNLMFITPLIFIFTAAFFGFGNERLTAFLQKHAALVKFSTALLFLVLLLMFLKNIY